MQKEFPLEEDLRVKTNRLIELDMLLNMDRPAPEPEDETPAELPQYCFAALSTGEIVKITKMENGYTSMGAYLPDDPDALDTMNDAIGVTRAQAAAMLAGSVYGWDCPGADPRNYDPDGKPLCAVDCERNNGSIEEIYEADMTD